MVNNIQITRLKLQDNKWMQLGDKTEETMDIFSIAMRTEVRPFEFAGMHTHLALVYEHDTNLYVTERRVGSYFDWISAAGGMNKGLRLFFSGIVNFFSYNVYSVYMVSHLFKKS